MNNHSGVGVNGCGRTKHITGGCKGEEARRDRHFTAGYGLVNGTSVKSPEPYLMPDQNKANPADAVKQRTVSFDMPHNQLARGENKITERRTHLTFGMNGAGILKGYEFAEKLNHTGPDLLEIFKHISKVQLRIERRISYVGM